MMRGERKWKYVIGPSDGLFDMKLRELWRYRDLVFLFVKRDFVSMYKQTILGPLWAIVNPVLSTVVFTVIFGNFAKLPIMDSARSGEAAIPAFLFYMIGNVLWGYFSATVKDVTNVFLVNAKVMGKVYYPRLASPVASAMFNLMTFFIRLALFAVLLVICVCNGSAAIAVSPAVMAFPLLIVELMLFSLGVGLVLASLTAKYRDMIILVDFGLQLWLYATPVAYGLQLIPEKWFGIYMLNPLASIFTAVRCLCFGNGYFEPRYFILGCVLSVAVFIAGVILFNRAEQTFIDTI